MDGWVSRTELDWTGGGLGALGASWQNPQCTGLLELLTDAGCTPLIEECCWIIIGRLIEGFRLEISLTCLDLNIFKIQDSFIVIVQ